MPIVAKEIIWGDGVSIDCYFCSEKCARAERKYRRKEQEDIEELNRKSSSFYKGRKIKVLIEKKKKVLYN